MSEYPVPQFIEEESKIIFFLTFRQFFIIVGGGLICFLFYLILPFIFFAIGSVLVALIVVVVAFFKINNESAVKILFNFIGFSLGSKNYVWKKEGALYSKQKNEPSFTSQEYVKRPTEDEVRGSKLKGIKKNIELKREN